MLSSAITILAWNNPRISLTLWGNIIFNGFVSSGVWYKATSTLSGKAVTNGATKVTDDSPEFEVRVPLKQSKRIVTLKDSHLDKALCKVWTFKSFYLNKL